MVVKRGVEKRREGTDYRDAEGVLACDQVACKDTPCALSVADATATRVAVNCDGELDAMVEDFGGEGLRHQDCSGLAKRARA